MENNLRKLRKARKMKMEQAAKLAGCSVSTLTKLESGERNLSNEWVAKFSEIYDVMPYELSDDPGYVLKIDNLEKMIKPKDDDLIPYEITTTNEYEREILTIFKRLNICKRLKLMQCAYDLEKDDDADK